MMKLPLSEVLFAEKSTYPMRGDVVFVPEFFQIRAYRAVIVEVAQVRSAASK